MRLVSLTAFALVLFAAPLSAQTVQSDGKLLFKTCAGTSTPVSDKNVCYVVDTKSGDNKWVIELCTGINISGGTIVLGGRVSTMLCGTVEITGAKTKKEAIKEAESWLHKHLKDPKTCADLAKKLASNKPPTKVEPFKVREDKETGDKLKDLRDKAK